MWREMDEGGARKARPAPGLPPSHAARRGGGSGTADEDDGEDEDEKDENGGCEEPEDGRETPESAVAHEAGNGEAMDASGVLK